ncbi:DUF155-domain-containing protein [Suhomyces tanzawaensis NRRL Y-17324]|uniref:DUF155-domain-containing protein n=1 Tax=Suhomyces tanzawaensis NRRL Y-17324 TaxID=984487 RepID=A0A1E4SG35_9ASCO|nr:DUF155-domain-containing protein [Suhomyces tanzawaensis NRRL Y-17324]ODV78474.1 DUF155-domain-containing protein [Suhomyces tanzawaensis NRRL Y-17324]
MLSRLVRPRTFRALAFSRPNSSSSGPSASVSSSLVRFPKHPKKKVSIQKLRRTDPAFLDKSTSYILSLLNENSSVYSPSKTLEKYLSPVTSITVGESIDFEVLLNDIKGYEYQIIVPEEVVNIRFHEKDLMILSNGTLVGWDISEDDILANFLPVLRDSITEKYPFESEEMDWIELNYLPDNPLNNGNSYLQGEVMVIQGTSLDRKMLDKAAFAIGLSRSTRLSILENTFEDHLQLTKKNSRYLSKGLKVTASESDFLKSTGQLFLLRGKLNLYSELIETPDLYWSEPALERIYNSVSKILDINSRISILNRKLDYATEEQRAFLSVLNEKKGTRLEWIIIILIMVEVGFESVHFYEKYT